MKTAIFFSLSLILMLFFLNGCTPIKNETVDTPIKNEPISTSAKSESIPAKVNLIDPSQSLQIINKCTWSESYDWRDTSVRHSKVYRLTRGKDCNEAVPIYEWYINRLKKEVIEPVDPEVVESAYKRWQSSQDLAVIRALMKCTFGNKVVNRWTNFIDDFFIRPYYEDKFLLSTGTGKLGASDLGAVKLAYWKYRFVETYSYQPNFFKDRNHTITIWVGVENLRKEIDSINKRIEEEKVRKEAQLQKQKEVEAKKRVEAEKAERIRIVRANRLKSYNVTAELTTYELCSNPFKYQGRRVVIKLMFVRMMEKTVGVFSFFGGDCEILVSNLPSDLFSRSGEPAELIVKVKGTTEVVNRLGATFKVPHLEFIAN